MIDPWASVIMYRLLICARCTVAKLPEVISSTLRIVPKEDAHRYAILKAVCRELGIGQRRINVHLLNGGV